MLKILKDLNKKLDNNYSIVHKVIFTLSVFLLYRVFIRSIGYDDFSIFNLIFVLIGFFVYSVDKLIPVIINVLESILKTDEKISYKTRVQSFIAFVFILISVFSAIMYFITSKYAWASMSVVFLCIAVLSVYFASEYASNFYKLSVMIFIVLTLILGITSIVHCFIYNDLLNIYLFVFIIIFFLTDLIIPVFYKGKLSD
ncbi:MAG: hypothetical protein ACM3PT_07815 [Deltaproteobacteria bacterium]